MSFHISVKCLFILYFVKVPIINFNVNTYIYIKNKYNNCYITVIIPIPL